MATRPKISFVLNYCTVEEDKHLLLDVKDTWLKQTDSEDIYQTTVQVINNINNYCKYPHEIILVDNSDTWKPIEIDNLKVVKGLQTLTREELKVHPLILEHQDCDIIEKEWTELDNLTMHVSLGMYVGTTYAKGDYVVCQHNDFYYHGDFFKEFMKLIEDEYEYISADNKKVWLGTYGGFKEVRDILGDDVKMLPFDGGFVKTDLGFADLYFFMCKKSFFDDYKIDWKYGDSNHGATIKCIEQGFDYYHIRRYYDNPNFPTADGVRTYYHNGKPFGSHLKGGISENRMSNKLEVKKWLDNI